MVEDRIPQTIFYCHDPWSKRLTKAFKCDVCNYECEKYVTLKKHKNIKHGIYQYAKTQTEERDSKTPDQLFHPIPLHGHRERRMALEVTAAREPQEKFYQIGIRYKRRNQITPIFVREPTTSMHSPKHLRNTKTNRATAAIGENHEINRHIRTCPT